MERLENGVLVCKLIRVIEDQICAKHQSEGNMIDDAPITDTGRILNGSQSVTKVCICHRNTDFPIIFLCPETCTILQILSNTFEIASTSHY